MEQVLVIGAIPPELRAALASRYALVGHEPDLPDPARFRVAVTTSVTGADAALLENLPNLGLLACNGTGLDRIDLEAAARRGVRVQHTPDAVTDDTADTAIALLFAASRRVAEADRFVRAGRWGAERMTPSRRVSGRAAGIVGLGRIGSLVAQRLSGLGLHVAYTGPRAKPGAPWPYVPDIGALTDQSSVLILCCPGGDATRHLVTSDVLRRLGPNGVLVNVSRGTVVDEAALLAALTDGTVACAGLDVFAQEPWLDARFLALENVVLQPHYAAVTQETRAEMARVLRDAIEQHLRR